MPRSIQLLTAGGFLSFFAFGFIENLKGPLLPELLRSGDFNYRQGGTILLASYVGFILATIVAGILADVLSNRGVLFLAGVCLAIGCVAMGLSNTLPLLVLSMGIIGFGLGAIELGGNGLMVELHSDQRGRYLNLLATFHGFGSLLVPMYAAALLTLKVHWQAIYGSALLIVVPLTILFWPRAKIVSVDSVAIGELEVKTGWNWKEVQQFAFTLEMAAYYVLIAAYVASELGVAAWIVEYLQQNRQFSVGGSSMVLSTFFGLIMTGRLLGAFVVEPFGYTRAIAIALLGSSLCLAGGIFGPGPMIYLLPLSGLFMSIVFPTVVAAASDLHQAHIGTILGILFAFAGVGGAVGPWTIGVVSDYAGLTIGLSCCIAFSLTGLVSLAVVKAQS
jgi:MFS transporter, FHS family, glucose/mannose:H+ symporter